MNKRKDYIRNLHDAIDNHGKLGMDINILYFLVVLYRYNIQIEKNFDCDFNKVYNSVEIMPASISKGKVYRIHESGVLEENGYEKGYIYLLQGSSIELHFHHNDKEHYKIICGDKDAITSKFCNIGRSHEIFNVNYDTLIRTYKYIPSEMRK